MKLATFIDMSYIRRCKLGFDIDFERLSNFICSAATSWLSNKADSNVTIIRNVVVGSIPINVSDEDRDSVLGVNAFFSALKKLPCFEVITIPIRYHGFRLTRAQRELSDNPQERDFIPSEKAVDTSLVVRMLEFTYRDRAVDAICIVSGDQDMLPAIKSIRDSGRFVFIAGGNVQNTVWQGFISDENIHTIELLDHRDEIERITKTPTIISKKELSEMDILRTEIENKLGEMPNWSSERILKHLTLWTCQARIISETVDFENEDLRDIFGLLTHISKEYKPGFVPGLQKAYQADWLRMATKLKIELKEQFSESQS